MRHKNINADFITFDRGIALIDGKNVMNPKNFLGNPDDGDVTLKNQTHQLKLEHYFSDSWSSRMGVAYKNNSLKRLICKQAEISIYNIKKPTLTI